MIIVSQDKCTIVNLDNIKTIVEAEKYLKIKRKNISQCITGRNKTAGGFKWLTKESYMANCYKVGGEDETSDD